MVERSLSMREVPGSIPGTSKYFCSNSWENSNASSGNRTRAARVAGEHSTTEPTMPHRCSGQKNMCSCGGVVNATDSKSVSLWERRFESYRLRNCFVSPPSREHRWFSGRMLACHAGGPGSIPGRCTSVLRGWTNFCGKKMWRRRVSIPVPLAC